MERNKFHANVSSRLAWTARPGVYWAAPVVAGIPFGIGLLFVFLTSYQYLIDCYGPLAASALASATLFRYVGAGGLVMVVRPMYMNLSYTVDGQSVYAWPLSLLGFLSIGCLPVPFMLYFGAGKWLRQVRRSYWCFLTSDFRTNFYHRDHQFV